MSPSIPSSSLCRVVKNDENQPSLWPEYRADALPPGWRFTGVAGTREACLAQIAAEAATAAALPVASLTPPAPAATTAPVVSAARAPRPAAASRATALPFPRPDAPRRLIVFPHAGSGASYYHFLARALKSDPVELHIVQYPGREMRMNERAVESMPAMTQLLATEIAPLLAEKPFAFFGHSMGALISFELAHALREAGAPLPQRMFLSGRQAPHVRGTVLQVDTLDNAAFLDAVGRRYNALPAELLAHPEILELVLPSLRADFTLMQRYAWQPREPLAIGFTLLNGQDDPWIDAASLGAWQQHTARPLEQRMFAGGHFYLSETAAALRNVVLEALPQT